MALICGLLEMKKYLIVVSARNLTYVGMSGKQRRFVQIIIDDFSLRGVRDDSTHR